MAAPFRRTSLSKTTFRLALVLQGGLLTGEMCSSARAQWNDQCSTPIPIFSSTYTNTQSTANATSTGDPSPSCVTGFGNGVWYQFTPQSNGQLVADTIGSDFDTGLAIYTGTCSSLNLVACDDDGGGNLTSKASASLIAGTTYYILAGGYSGSTGNLVFHLSFTSTAPPANLTVGMQGHVAVLAISGSIKAAYEIQYSTNLNASNNWATLTGVTLPGSPYLLPDYSSTNRPVTFYRTLLRAPAVTAPRIGWVDFQKDPFGDLVSVLRTNLPLYFYNDVTVEILPGDGTGTHFTYGPTPAPAGVDMIPNPSPSVGIYPPAYRDGLHIFDMPPTMMPIQPDTTVEAVSFESGRLNSPTATARFQFKTANAMISGTSAAAVTITDQTTNAVIWYTTDGTYPTNAPPSMGPIASGTTVSLGGGSTNVTIYVRAFRANYQPSDITYTTFPAGP